MHRYIDVDALLEQIDIDAACGRGYYGDNWKFIDTINDMPVVTINDIAKEIIVTNCNHIVDDSKKAPSSRHHEDGKDCIDRAEAMTELMAIARRYTLSSEAHGEGRVLWGSFYIDDGEAMRISKPAIRTARTAMDPVQ